MMNESHAKIVGLISQHNRSTLEELSIKLKLPLARLVSIAIDRELSRDYPFIYDVSIPDGEFVDQAFIDEAGRIINYMKKVPGLSLDDMCLMRHDMNIPDKNTFLLAFRECVIKGFLESYKPKQQAFVKHKYDDDYVFYRIKGSSKAKAVALRRKASKYEVYQKLKKEFKDE